MTIPIQINSKPSTYCNGSSGKLPMWDYGLSNEYKDNMMDQYNHIGILSTLDMMNSPYYLQAKIDPEYVKFLKMISDCNKKN